MRYLISFEKLSEKQEKKLSSLLDQDIEPTRIGEFYIYTSEPLKKHGELYIIGEKYFDGSLTSEDLDLDKEDNIKIVEKIDRNFDGRYLYVDPNNSIISIDPIGLQTTYIGKTYIASDKKILWLLGEKTVYLLPPNTKWKIRKDVSLENRGKLIYLSPNKFDISIDDVADYLSKYLIYRMRKIVSNVNIPEKDVYIAFSGGIDSSITYYLAKKAGIKPILVTVCKSDSHDYISSKQSAEQLGMSNKHNIILLDSVTQHEIEETIYIIEDWNIMNLSLSLPLYMMMKRYPRKTFIMGQGSDEIYGGYTKYLNTYLEKGPEEVIKEMKLDTLLSYRFNFCRETKIARYFDSKLYYPLISPGIIWYVAHLPLEMKIKDEKDIYRKWIVRKIAEKYNLPNDIVMKKKKALQYSSKSQNLIYEILGKKNIGKRLYELYTTILNIG
jgi:asparagine synthase (glutamine-hydrolysing)